MRLFRSFLGADSTVLGDIYQLPPQASHHLIRVLRVKTGDKIEVFDGKGGRFEAEVTNIGKQLSVKLLSQKPSQTESPLSLCLIIAVGKGDKMDWIIQKATELGVTEIIPVITSRSEVRLSEERWQKKHEHWQEIIINACEQCGRDFIPTLCTVSSLSSRLQELKNGLKLLLHPGEASEKINVLLNQDKNSTQSPTYLLIGPEGGFDDKEVALAKTHYFKLAALGPRILRMETAAITSLAIIQAALGDM